MFTSMSINYGLWVNLVTYYNKCRWKNKLSTCAYLIDIQLTIQLFMLEIGIVEITLGYIVFIKIN